jgi:hypothetical protein
MMVLPRHNLKINKVMERRISLGILSLALAASVAPSYATISPCTGQHEVSKNICNKLVSLYFGNFPTGSCVATYNSPAQQTCNIVVNSVYFNGDYGILNSNLPGFETTFVLTFGPPPSASHREKINP